MKRKILLAFVFLTIFVRLIWAKSPGEIEWLGALGQDKANPDVYYSFLFLGFLRQELSPECNTFVASWFKKRPKAAVVPVAVEEPFNERHPKSQLIFVWIVDGHDNLSVDFVRHGCAPASFLYTLLPGAHSKISRIEFDRVKDRLLAAEKLAKSEKLGIWSKESETSSAEND